MKALAGAAAGETEGHVGLPRPAAARGERVCVRALLSNDTQGTIRRRSRPPNATKPQLLSMDNLEIVGFYCHLSAMFILSRAVLIK